jgi:hypothetical protein
MARNHKRLAERLAAKEAGRVPDTGCGAFDAARLAGIVRSSRMP